MARRCSVCKHPRSAEIDAALINASVSQASIAKDFHFNLRSLERHLAKHVRGNGSQALAIQRQVNRDLDENGHALAVAGQVQEWVCEAKRDREAALERKDWALALRAIDVAIKAQESQARLTFEARAGRASDLTSNPVFHDLVATITDALELWPDARASVVHALERRLGWGGSGLTGG